jgi:hypothetical protein
MPTIFPAGDPSDSVQPAGSFMWDTTGARLVVSDGTQWCDVAYTPPNPSVAGNTTPMIVGNTTSFAVANHVHPIPVVQVPNLPPGQIMQPLKPEEIDFIRSEMHLPPAREMQKEQEQEFLDFLLELSAELDGDE